MSCPAPGDRMFFQYRYFPAIFGKKRCSGKTCKSATYNNNFFCQPEFFLPADNLFFQQFTGKMNAAFNSTKRFFQYSRNFVVLITIKIQ